MSRSKQPLEKYYSKAKEFVIKAGYDWEIDWQDNVNFEDITESQFLSEAAWVVLCSGMHERVIRNCFKNVSICFLGWESSAEIIENKKYCVEYALQYFNNRRKINAIATIVEIVHQQGYMDFKEQLRKTPLETLKSLPYIGPITSYHLAKNIGLSFAKADRHLARISKGFGFNCVQEFCNGISRISGDTIQVVDVVLWRFANLKGTINRSY